MGRGGVARCDSEVWRGRRDRRGRAERAPAGPATSTRIGGL